MGDFWTTFFYFIVMIAVIVGAYLATKYIAGKGVRAKSRYIRMVDRVTLGRDKHIVLLNVGDKNLLIGVTNQSMNVLGDIDIAGEKTAQPNAGQPGTQPAPKGFMSQMRDFIVTMKKAPSNLNKARMNSKKDHYTQSVDSEDYLTRMDEAIRKRKDRTPGGTGDES